MQTYMDDKNFLPKNRKGAAEELKDARITCSSQKQLYKIENERKKSEYDMDWLPESFW